MHQSFWHRLPNGLRVLTLEMPHLNSLAVELFVRDGSRWEGEETNGLSHLVEHMLFNGNASYRLGRDLALAVAELGGAMNGEVGQEMAEYSLWTRPQHLDRSLEVFASMFTEPLFDEEELELEKRIILAEIGEQPSGSTLDQLLWPNHPLSFPVPGKRKTVVSFTREQVVTHYRRFYVPDNLVLVVAGPVSHRHVERLAARLFGRLSGRFRERYVSAPAPAPVPQTRFTTLRDITSYQVSLAYPFFPRTNPDRAAYWLLNTILGTSDTSRLFLKLREELGLVYSVDSHTALWSDTGVIEIEFKVARSRLRRALAQVLDQTACLRSERVSQAEMDRAKEWRIASLESLLDDPDGLARRYAAGTLFGDYLALEDLAELTAAVTPEDILGIAQAAFREEGSCLLIQGPELQTAGRAELRALFRKRRGFGRGKR